MKKCIFILLLLSIVLFSNAQIEIPLKGRLLSENGITEKEREVSPHIFENISKGMLYVYLPTQPNLSMGTSVVICPGGGYRVLGMQGEGHVVAQWLAANGIVGIVYKYRLPNKHGEILLADAEEVFEIIRKNAKKWHLDTTKIGIAGFSAGGHLASHIATSLRQDLRPNFSILFYPVTSMDSNIVTQYSTSKSQLFDKPPTSELLQKMSTDKCVDSSTPPTLIFVSDDDKIINPLNSILFYKQLKAYNIPSAMYVFPSGNHGFGFGKNFPYHKNMKQLLSQWLKERKLMY